MYDNIGGKIKGLAKALFIVAAIAEVITGIALMASDEELIVYGLLVMVVGPIIAWVSSWLLYGFGEIIEKLTKIEQNTHGYDIKKQLLQKEKFKNAEKDKPIKNDTNIESKTKIEKIEPYKSNMINNDTFNQIEKLRQQGLITEEEYQALLAKI